MRAGQDIARPLRVPPKYDGPFFQFGMILAQSLPLATTRKSSRAMFARLADVQFDQKYTVSSIDSRKVLESNQHDSSRNNLPDL